MDKLYINHNILICQLIMIPMVLNRFVLSGVSLPASWDCQDKFHFWQVAKCLFLSKTHHEFVLRKKVSRQNILIEYLSQSLALADRPTLSVLRACSQSGQGSHILPLFSNFAGVSLSLLSFSIHQHEIYSLNENIFQGPQ